MSADTVLMDELREQQTWDAWGAIKNTTMAREDGLVVGISNAGDAASVVLKDRRDAGIAQIDEGTSLGVFSWSAHEDADLDDVTAWAQANPAMGYTVTLDALIDAREDPEHIFKTENLCQWVTSKTETYLDSEKWNILADAKSQVSDDSELAIAVDVAADREWSAVTVAGFRDDGLAHAEVIAYREGIFWVVDFVKQVMDAQGIEEVVLQERGCPAAELINAFKREEIEVRGLSGSEPGFATGQFKDALRDETLRHLDQPPLNLAVEGALTKKLGEAQVWDRNASVTDAAPLVAASWALYALKNEPPSEEPKSAYSQTDDGPDWWTTAREKTSKTLNTQSDWWR